MDIRDFSYDLPQDLIGQEAIEPRDSCKLLLVNRTSSKIEHHIFRDLVDLLTKDYCLVLNDTKVFPARLFGTKESGGKVELLLLKQQGIDSYQAIGKGKMRVGLKVVFGSGLNAEVVAKDVEGQIVLKFNFSGVELLEKIDELGKTPLPPYIHSDTDEKRLREQYQTVYAREKGSAAAPTAGLHFTPELLQRLTDKGVQIEKVTLHVGLGTFKPVTPEQIDTQILHTEAYWVNNETALRLNVAKKSGKKIIAVGTTTCRVLESQTDTDGVLSPGEGETNIFIQPGYKFKFVDGLITNFHLPQTSLLMLITALVCTPNSPTKFSNFNDSLAGMAYEEAVKNRYKFFSFGDSMIIL